ncbi:E3 ubiquitin-protein ligase [Oopsacas minuta]|uniref:E3 ubiquitin-protein ligase n=1 Tax=Oopsacas minuta TaxID=111878 RepID=A0AAV7K9X3_9METZ|nr:E3 ubiquitin-protein ligase [Oopsacas minuta]
MENDEIVSKLGSLLENLDIKSSVDVKSSVDIKSSVDEATDSETANSLECPICLQYPNYPIELDNCKHVFCFLCIKGVCLRISRCPICRAEIPRDIAFAGITENQLLNGTGTKEVSKQSTDAYWYYEGYRGWWEYDSVTGSKIEQAFQSGEHKLNVYLFGYNYTINLDKMQQCREDSTNRVRKILRNEVQMDSDKKGVAGIFSTKNSDK